MEDTKTLILEMTWRDHLKPHERRFIEKVEMHEELVRGWHNDRKRIYNRARQRMRRAEEEA